MMSRLSVGQVVIFWALTLTTVFGGLIYVGYLGIVYRMDRADPVVGPEIRAREAELALRTRADHERAVRFLGSPLVWGPVVALLVFVLCAGNIRTQNITSGRFIAGDVRFFTLIQCLDRPALYG